MYYLRSLIRKEDNDDFKSTLILAMCLGYIIHFFMNSFLSLFSSFILCFIVFFMCLRNSNPLPRYFSIAMFALGVIFSASKGSIQEIVTGLQSNLPLLTLIILVPMLSLPLKAEGYFESVQFYLEKWSSDNRKIFGSISLFIFCLGPILNLGSIRIIHETIKDFKSEPILLAKSYLVGFSTVILWSPYFASVAMLLYYLNVPLVSYIPLGLTLAAVQLVLGNLLFWGWLKKNEPGNLFPVRSHMDNNLNVFHKNKMLHLFILVLLLMAGIFSMEHITQWPMMFIVSLISIFFPLAWSFVKQRKEDFLIGFKEYKSISVPRMDNEVVLFLSAGLFAKSLTGTAVADSIKLFLTNIANISFLLFIVSVMGSILFFTFIGIHQIVIVTVLATQMNPELIGTALEVLALLLMVSWSMSSVLSPVNPLNLLVSNSLKRSGIAVGFKWNGIYLVSMMITGTLFIYLIH